MTEHGLGVFKGGCPVVNLPDDMVPIFKFSCYLYTLELFSCFMNDSNSARIFAVADLTSRWDAPAR